MKIGLMFITSGPFSDPDLFAHLVTTAERCGVESIWSVEHVVIPANYKSPYPYSASGKIPGGEDVPIPDPLAPLAFAAAISTKIRLGTGVIILPQRHPVYLAKEVATIDVLSKGRMMLGIGSGWLKEEFDAVGVDFHQRGARTDESILAMRALWRDNPSTFHGKFFNFDSVKCFPKPVQKNGVPILIGGHSTAAAKRAGRLGDGFFPASVEPEKLKPLLAIMGEEARKAGRNPDQIEVSCMGRRSGETVKALEDVGISRMIVPPPGLDKDAVTRGLEKLASDVIAKS
ncbi:MAG TPA: LLM class F420-dependent oxidoreductase [Candidatus Binataceae bacterium]|nr:LLM class F420-dependent oxidoreductase [Candidatus Binataceae bacterium]